MTVQKNENEGRKSGAGNDADVYSYRSEASDDLTEIEVANSPRASSVLGKDNFGIPLDISISPIKQSQGSSQVFRLIRFSSLSTKPWTNEMSVIAVKVWQDLELTSVGVFLPLGNGQEFDEIVKFKVYSNQGWLIYGHDEEIAELYPTDLKGLAEMKLPSAVRFSAHRRYFLVMNMGMGGLSTMSGEEGKFLHCLSTLVGGVQIAFENPEVEELEEFLVNVENNSSTRRGQIPALYLRLPVCDVK